MNTRLWQYVRSLPIVVSLGVVLILGTALEGGAEPIQWKIEEGGTGTGMMLLLLLYLTDGFRQDNMLKSKNGMASKAIWLL